MNVDNLLDTVLSKAAGADAAEVFYESSESRPVEFEDNRLKYVATKSGRGVGLRVIRDGRLGFSSTSDFDRLDELVENAMESAKFGEQARFEMPASCEPAQVKVSDDAISKITTKEMTEIGQAGIDALLQHHPDVQCSAEIDATESTERLVNSKGLDVGHASTSFSAHLTALSVTDDGFQWVGDGKSGCRLLPNITPFVDKVSADLERSKTAAKLDTGIYPAVFTPDAMSVLLISLSQGVNGKIIQKGASPLSDRLGEQILDKRISVIDDSLVDYASSSAPHDTEGLTSRQTPLVENGVLQNYLFDLQTAGIMGVEPTGNGLRGYSSQPSPGHNNTMVSPGDTSFDDMVAGIEKGILVDHVLGGGMSNTLAGEFSVNVELGFIIENGALGGRVKNCMIFGNVYDLLKDGIACIGDVCQMKSSLSMPHFCFKGISIGSQ
jgi:PmbA protein